MLVDDASGSFSGSFEGDGSGLSGLGSGFPFTGSAAISGTFLVTGSENLAVRISGSTALTGSLFVSGTVSGSFEGDGSALTGIAAGGFPHTGSAAISGTLNVTGSGVNAVEITGSLVVTGSAFVTSLTETSALRFKENIEPMGKELDTVSLLRPVDFVWKESKEVDKGLIAEEVQMIYPEFVTLNTDGTTQGIKYSKIVSVLIKSIQELKEEVEILKTKING